MFLYLDFLQRVIVVRHGQSAYNKLEEESRGLEDPTIFDPEITDKGRKQVRNIMCRGGPA